MCSGRHHRHHRHLRGLQQLHQLSQPLCQHRCGGPRAVFDHSRGNGSRGSRFWPDPSNFVLRAGSEWLRGATPLHNQDRIHARRAVDGLYPRRRSEHGFLLKPLSGGGRMERACVQRSLDLGRLVQPGGGCRLPDHEHHLGQRQCALCRYLALVPLPVSGRAEPYPIATAADYEAGDG